MIRQVLKVLFDVNFFAEVKKPLGLDRTFFCSVSFPAVNNMWLDPT